MNAALDLAIKASVVFAVGAVIDLLLRRASAATRHFAWTMTVIAVLALPVALVVVPAWPVAITLPSVAPVDAAVTTTAASTSAAAAAPATRTTADSTFASRPADGRPPFDPFAFAFAIYSAGVVLLLSRLVTQQLALKRLTARADAIEDPEWVAVLSASARRMGVRRPVRLLRSDDEVMPFTFGTRQPTIVLPEASARWSVDRRTAVILHELAHVARADCLAQRCAAVACALYWPHPGAWWAARRLRVEREFASDDRVLSAGTGAREYAHHLLEIAHAFRGTPAPATALGMARARQLEHRLLAVIDEARNRQPIARRARIGAAAAAAALLLPVAALQAHVRAGGTEHPAAAVLSAAAPVDAAGQDRPRDRADEDYSGTWELHPTGEPGMVNVNLRTAHSQHGRTLPLSRFADISDPGMTAAVRDGRIVDGTVHFASRRDAGTFTFDGVCRNQRCGGTYTFAPDPAFPSRLAKYGVGTPTPAEQYRLAIVDVGVAYLEGLKGEGYSIPDVHTLVRAAEHGVSLEYVKSMSALGYKLGTMDPLIRMRDHGVNPDFVKGLAAQGFTKLEADQLVRLRDHGVTPEYVKGMRDLGYASADPSDLVTARDHGVSPEFVRGVASRGYTNVPLDTLTRMRDHGVSPEYVRGMSEAGYRNVPIPSLIRMRDHGVDSEYVRGVAAGGYKDVEIDSLIRMRDHGVSPDYIRRVQARGVKNLSVEDLIRLRDGGGK
jgi:beta-lactamase regulating signal transducer with metallopeptidase domain